MNYSQKIITDIELHSTYGIRECFINGVSPNDTYKNKTLFDELISEYKRGPSFKECVKVFVEYGLEFNDMVLLSVLMDDASSLENQLVNKPEAIENKYSFDCAFTQMHEVSLLHICAEYNHIECAKILVKYGADVNSKAGYDNNGFGGHTPVFHTVNQHDNLCVDMMKYLISLSADLTITVPGLIWGKGYEWETFIPSVNPLSYAMMGLLRQFQRTEKDIYEVVKILLKTAYNIEYEPANITNKYLSN